MGGWAGGRVKVGEHELRRTQAVTKIGRAHKRTLVFFDFTGFTDRRVFGFLGDVGISVFLGSEEQSQGSGKIALTNQGNQGNRLGIRAINQKESALKAENR